MKGKRTACIKGKPYTGGNARVYLNGKQQVSKKVGGNLSTMLDAVTNTIRDRVRLFSEVRALTSQQRFSGYLLSLLPFIVAAVLFIINPEYISRLFEPGIFLCIPIGALVLVILGNIVIRMLSKIDV